VDVDIPASSTAEKETISVKVWARRVWTLELSLVGDISVNVQTAGRILTALTDLIWDLKLASDHFSLLVLSHFAFRTFTSIIPPDTRASYDARPASPPELDTGSYHCICM
jgi:hypothetical protein